jgi:N-acetylmuramoyl-L-alanine amidase
MKTIAIDPGHGGKFPGATVRTVKDGVETVVMEKDINLKAAVILNDLLRAYGLFPTLLRDYDRELGETVGEDLRVRCDIERFIKVDCFVSIHCNAAVNPMARGFEVWTSPGKTRADDLATRIFDEVKACNIATLRMRSDESDGDPDKEGNLYVLRHTRSPAVLLELGFITNPGDLDILQSDHNLTTLMTAVADGIKAWGKDQEVRHVG